MDKNIDRRSFLRAMAGTGVLVATSSLPAVAATEEKDQERFPRRGRYERLSLSYATVRIGLEKPFSVLHISDTHLAEAYPSERESKQILHEKRCNTFGGHQEEALRDTLAWARDNVDYVLHTGDLIDWQSEANFDLVRKYFGEAAMTGCMGNHEFSPDMWLSDPSESRDEAFKAPSRDALGKAYPFDIEITSQIVGGVNFVCLDDVYGYVTESQVTRFKEEVRKGLPVVLCMHVPFFTPDIWRATHRFWKCNGSKFTDGSVPEPTGDYKVQIEDKVTRDFISYLKKEKLLKAILAGHEHFTMQDRFSKTATEYLIGGNFLLNAREILFI